MNDMPSASPGMKEREWTDVFNLWMAEGEASSSHTHKKKFWRVSLETNLEKKDPWNMQWVKLMLATGQFNSKSMDSIEFT